MRASTIFVLPRIFVVIAVLYWTTGPAPVHAATSTEGTSAGAPGAPVVVELFTSQGCSSCPPADELLNDLARTRDDVIALSLHVDYWDYIGWKDPYGSPMHTARQRAYAAALRIPYVFTPQVVIDGRVSQVGSDRGAILAAIDTARARRKALRIEFVADNGGKVVIPQGHAPDVGATVWLVVYDRYHETKVKRGENAGRVIRNANVVRRLERLGTWTGERLEIPLNLTDAAVSGRYGCAVIVQQGRTGPVLGAAAMRLDALIN